MGMTLTASAQHGMHTDAYTARVAAVCTHRTILCADCVTIQGPQRPSLLSFASVGDSGKVYELLLAWEAAYRGVVTVDLQAARYACNLHSGHKC
jgi:hypothetical protein